MAVNLRTLKDNWLMDAATEGRATQEQQLAWLQSERQRLSIAVRDGDWAVTGQTAEGSGHSAVRGVSGADQLTALIAAIKALMAIMGLIDDSSTGAMLTITAQDILS